MNFISFKIQFTKNGIQFVIKIYILQIIIFQNDKIYDNNVSSY